MADMIEVKTGWLIDGSGGPIQRGALLRLEKGRVLAVDTTQNADLHKWVPLGSTQIDLSGCTVLPGLVDAHVHLCMSGTGDTAVRQAQLIAGYRETRAVIAGHLSRHFTWGVVAVRDGGDRQGHALRFKEEIAADGGVPVQIRTAGKAWKKAGRYGRLIGRSVSEGMTLGRAVGLETDAIDHVKVVNSGLNSLVTFGKETTPQFTREELSNGVAAAANKGLGVMVHANGVLPVAIAVEAGCRSVEHGYFMGADNLSRMADKQVTWVPTALPMAAYADLLEDGGPRRDVARKTLEDQLGQIVLARRLGVPIALGTDAGSLGAHHGRGVAAEMRLLMSAGFSLEEAVACATANGARLLGLENQGRLATGMRATFVVVKGAPEDLPESLGRVSCVYVDGVRMESS